MTEIHWRWAVGPVPPVHVFLPLPCCSRSSHCSLTGVGWLETWLWWGFDRAEQGFSYFFFFSFPFFCQSC